MTDAFKQQIQAEARQAVEELLEQAKLKKGDVFVVGCSSSEIVGGHIGKDSSLEAAQAVYAGIAPVLAQRGIWLAAQCCEHLNRAIIMEREAAEQYGWEEVCVVPRPHAGGSWATTCWKQFKDPIAVEEIRAHAGIDIGGTLIGMHATVLTGAKIGRGSIIAAGALVLQDQVIPPNSLVVGVPGKVVRKQDVIRNLHEQALKYKWEWAVQYGANPNIGGETYDGSKVF